MADPSGESPDRSEEGRQWIWISYAPEFRLRLTAFVGPRTLASALSLIEMTVAVGVGLPCFFSDGLSSYLPALVAFYHQVKPLARPGLPVRARQPVLEPQPDLVYGQVIKPKAKGRLKALHYRVVCGAQRLAQLGLTISTSLLQRLNLTLRQHSGSGGNRWQPWAQWGSGGAVA